MRDSFKLSYSTGILPKLRFQLVNFVADCLMPVMPILFPPSQENIFTNEGDGYEGCRHYYYR